jgi:hypothetical protein
VCVPLDENASALGRIPIGTVTVRLIRRGAALRVKVTDAGSSTSSPAVHAPALDDGTGRGLWMVDMLADAWGFDRDENGACVWFLFTAPERPEGGRL